MGRSACSGVARRSALCADCTPGVLDRDLGPDREVEQLQTPAVLPEPLWYVTSFVVFTYSQLGTIHSGSSDFWNRRPGGGSCPHSERTSAGLLAAAPARPLDPPRGPAPRRLPRPPLQPPSSALGKPTIIRTTRTATVIQTNSIRLSSRAGSEQARREAIPPAGVRQTISLRGERSSTLGASSHDHLHEGTSGARAYGGSTHPESAVEAPHRADHGEGCWTDQQPRQRSAPRPSSRWTPCSVRRGIVSRDRIRRVRREEGQWRRLPGPS